VKDIVALVIDMGLGAAALHLAYSLNKTVKQLTVIVDKLVARVTALENK